MPLPTRSIPNYSKVSIGEDECECRPYLGFLPGGRPRGPPLPAGGLSHYGRAVAAHGCFTAAIETLVGNLAGKPERTFVA